MNVRQRDFLGFQVDQSVNLLFVSRWYGELSSEEAAYQAALRCIFIFYGFFRLIRPAVNCDSSHKISSTR